MLDEGVKHQLWVKDGFPVILMRSRNENINIQQKGQSEWKQ
jgi:hypothetical protein